MMAPTDLRVQLVQLRTHVRRHDALAAEELIGALIDDLSSNGHAPKLPPLHRPAKETCPFGWKYSTKGKRQRNRKHVCAPECSWTARQCLGWNPPYKVSDADGRAITIQSRLVPVPPCAKCDRPRRDHWEIVADDDGRMTGYREIKECQYEPASGR